MGDLLQEALDRVAALVGGVPADALRDPTPCPGWDVGALLNHMVASNVYFAASARRQEADRAAVYGADQLGGDAEASYRRSAAAAVDAWRAPGALDGAVPSGMPAQALWAIHLAEVLAHGWDLAQATGQDPDLPAEACEAALAVLRTFPPGNIRQPGVFDDEVASAEDAPAHDRLAAFLGRHPGLA